MRAPKRRALLTLVEVADELGVSRRTIERRIAAGELEAIHDGTRITRVRREALDDYRVRREALDAYIAARAEPAC